MKNSYKCAVMALIFSALSTTVQAKTTLKVAATVPVGTPWADHLIEWKENVESASGGEIELEFFLGGQLGNEYDVYRQVQRGRIDIGWFTGAVMAENVPEIALMSTPFFFRESKTLDCVYGGKFGDQLATYVSEDGVKMLQWQETGWVSIIAKDDLSDVEAAKGYKARVAPQPMSRTLWSSVGANVSEIPYMEMPSALQTNLIKSGETAAISYFAFGLDKVAPHYIRTRHLHQAGAILINPGVWDKLSAEQQAVLEQGLPDLQAHRDSMRKLTEEVLAKYNAKSGNVHELTDAQYAAWKAKVEPNWPNFVNELGERPQSIWPDLIKAKAACEN